ncbi:MAG: flagellar hook-length control protein FliK [Bacillota bacterium]
MKAIESAAINALQKVIGESGPGENRISGSLKKDDFARTLKTLVKGKGDSRKAESGDGLLQQLQSLLHLPEGKLSAFLEGEGKLDLEQLQQLIQLKGDLDSLLSELDPGFNQEDSMGKDGEISENGPPGKTRILKLASLLAVSGDKRKEMIGEMSLEERQSLTMSFPAFMQGLRQINRDIKDALNSEDGEKPEAVLEMLITISTNGEEDIPDEFAREKSLLAQDTDGQTETGAADSQVEKAISRLAEVVDDTPESREMLLPDSVGGGEEMVDVEKLTGALDSLEMSNLRLKEEFSRQVKDKSDFSLKNFLQKEGIEYLGADKTSAVRSGDHQDLDQGGRFNLFDTDLQDNGSSEKTILNKLSSLTSLEDSASGERSDIVRQITSQISKNYDSGVDKLRIQLEPESLGKVDLQLDVQEGKVQVRLVVENAKVRNHLEQNLQGLKANLVNQGLKVEGLEIKLNNNVDAGAGENNFGFDQQMQGQTGDQQDGQGNLYQSGYFNLTSDEREEVFSSYTPQELAGLRLKLGSWYGGDRSFFRGANLSAFG